MQRHFATEIQGGPFRHREQSDSGFLMVDGHYLKIAYYRIARDGKEFSPADLESRNQQTNQDWAAGKIYFKEPYDSRYLNEYTFALQDPCSSCDDGMVAVNFSSAIHDAQHGSGTMWIDAATAHVERLMYTPNELPSHASTGTVTETSGQVLPGLWYVTRIDEHFEGHAFLFRGTGTFTATFDHFQRFATPSNGQVALLHATI